MHYRAVLNPARLAVSLLVIASLWGCGPGEDKSKTEKKAEPAAPPKVTPAPPPPKKKEEAKPAPKTAAGPDGWILLGEQQVDHKTERDRFAIGAKAGKFRELRVVVRGAEVTIDEMVVTFANNQQFTPKMKHKFEENSSSRAIDLPGEASAIKEVDFTYRGVGVTGGRATVLLYGR